MRAEVYAAARTAAWGGVLLMAALHVQASVLPPHRPPTVITHCGQVTTVFTTTKTGYVKHIGADAIRIANKVPYNLRIESGCSN